MGRPPLVRSRRREARVEKGEIDRVVAYEEALCYSLYPKEKTRIWRNT